jgi:hypothetical protein
VIPIEHANVHMVLWRIISVCLFAFAGLEQVIVASMSKEAALPKMALFAKATRRMVLGFGAALGFACATLMAFAPWIFTADASEQAVVAQVGPCVGGVVVTVWADACATAVLFVQTRFFFLTCSYIIQFFVLLALSFFCCMILVFPSRVQLGISEVWSWILILFFVRFLLTVVCTATLKTGWDHKILLYCCLIICLTIFW